MAFIKLAVSAFALAGSVLAQNQQQLPLITMKGSKLFYENGTQFFIKGVAYQQDTSAGGATNERTTKYIDPLADEDKCKRDVPKLAKLGTNTIRTYAIDPKADHSACMELLSAAGIYVISDLSEPAISINRDTPQWDTVVYKRYVDVIDEMSKYRNTIGFFAGNEVSNNITNTQASAYVKAAVRDMKKYIKDTKNRWMGVGYAANDDVAIRKEIADYFNCGKEEDAIDFWGYNIYSWCGKSNLQSSGYSKQVEFFSNYSVPVFFAEYGCNNDGGKERMFTETEALYSDAMTGVFSGGIVYMYFQETNDYGLVEVKGNTATELQPAFNALMTEATKARPSGVARDSYNPNNKPQDCPSPTLNNWKAHASLPPTPDQSLCDCMVKSSSCVHKEGLEPKRFGNIFGFICGDSPEICTGIRGNASLGVYGAYSMCTDSAKLDYVLDAYYKKLNKASSACDFEGQANIQTAAAEESCNKKLAQASDINKQVATATAPISTPTSSDDSLAVPGALMARVLSVGDYTVGLYMVMALLAGAGMVVL